MTLQSAPRPHREQMLLRLIGVVKLLKGFLLAVASIAALRLIHRDVGDVIIQWAHRLHIAPGNRHLQFLLSKLSVTHRELRLLAIAFAAYSAMFTTEGIGLLLLKPWAEWMTVFTTAGLIPFEIYELMRSVTLLKLFVFAVNVAIAVYLVRNLTRRRVIPS